MSKQGEVQMAGTCKAYGLDSSLLLGLGNEYIEMFYYCLELHTCTFISFFLFGYVIYFTHTHIKKSFFSLFSFYKQNLNKLMYPVERAVSHKQKNPL